MEHEHTHNHSHDHSHNHENFEAVKREELTKIIISAVFFAAGYIIGEFTSLPAFMHLICFGVSYIAVGFGVVRNAIEDIFEGKIFNECFMISIASLGAFAIKEFDEGCAVMLLYAVGEYIHGLALSKSKKQIREIEHNDHGEHVHESGDTESFIAHFAKIYTPVICAISLLVIVIPPLFMGGEWKEWIYRGLSVLVIGCPCAIVISVPLSFSCAIDACTRKGIYIYHTNALEKLHKNGSGEGIIVPDGNEHGLAFAKKAASKAVIISRENIILALTVKAVVLVLAVFMEKELPMWLAAFSDVGIAGLAILNSLRSLRIK
ncbi:MAG: hypothetical protein IKF64_03350 [Eubacterium sp.]|nr:hypothetical protein [Eubacterium sp.]